MLVKIARLDKLGGFRLRVSFTDGTQGVHDFTALVNEPGPMLEPLRDEASARRLGRTASTLRRNGCVTK